MGTGINKRGAELLAPQETLHGRDPAAGIKQHGCEAVTKYYGVYPAAGGAGSQRIAMRTGASVYYLLSDRLGSTTITVNASTGETTVLRYEAWGGVRYSSGVTATDYTYTGQYSQMDEFGLMFYNARWESGIAAAPSAPLRPANAGSRTYAGTMSPLRSDCARGIPHVHRDHVFDFATGVLREGRQREQTAA